MAMNDNPLRLLENRVARLEEEIQQLKIQLLEPDRKGWQAIVGCYADKKTAEAIAREGRKIRRAEREAALRAEREADRAEGKGKAGSPPRSKTRRTGEAE
jgi:alpha-D-ribose 1-methylphosphonate 5-triphosphate synthase subunit PhnL